MMDTALVIMIMCNGDNYKFRRTLKEMYDEGESVYWTVEDFEKVYEETGWKAENEKLDMPLSRG